MKELKRILLNEFQKQGRSPQGKYPRHIQKMIDKDTYEGMRLEANNALASFSPLRKKNTQALYEAVSESENEDQAIEAFRQKQKALREKVQTKQKAKASKKRGKGQDKSTARPPLRTLTDKKEETINAVVVGDGAVGKTSMLATFMTGGFPGEYHRPTETTLVHMHSMTRPLVLILGIPMAKKNTLG